MRSLRTSKGIRSFGARCRVSGCSRPAGSTTGHSGRGVAKGMRRGGRHEVCETKLTATRRNPSGCLVFAAWPRAEIAQTYLQRNRGTYAISGPVARARHVVPLPLHHCSFARQPVPYFLFTCQRAIAAPVGSIRTLNEPMPVTSVTSFITVAPSDLAFFVEAAMSSTRT
jgi:hypothetical protein